MSERKIPLNMQFGSVSRLPLTEEAAQALEMYEQVKALANSDQGLAAAMNGWDGVADPRAMSLQNKFGVGQRRKVEACSVFEDTKHMGWRLPEGSTFSG